MTDWDINPSEGAISGADISCSMTLPEFDPRVTQQYIILDNISAVSWSVHRDKSPVRRLGTSRTPAYTKGPRTIAGSLVFVNFDRTALYEAIDYLNSELGIIDRARSILADQLPPFNMHFLMVNEMGKAATMTLYGIDIVDEGMVMGVDEAYLETAMQYVAQDIIPVAPFRLDAALTRGWKDPRREVTGLYDDLGKFRFGGVTVDSEWFESKALRDEQDPTPEPAPEGIPEPAPTVEKSETEAGATRPTPSTPIEATVYFTFRGAEEPIPEDTEGTVVVTDTDGNPTVYNFTGPRRSIVLAPGTYTLSVLAPGYERLEREAEVTYDGDTQVFFLIKETS